MKQILLGLLIGLICAVFLVKCQKPEVIEKIRTVEVPVEKEVIKEKVVYKTKYKTKIIDTCPSPVASNQDKPTPSISEPLYLQPEPKLNRVSLLLGSGRKELKSSSSGLAVDVEVETGFVFGGLYQRKGEGRFEDYSLGIGLLNNRSYFISGGYDF